MGGLIYLSPSTQCGESEGYFSFRGPFHYCVLTPLLRCKMYSRKFQNPACEPSFPPIPLIDGFLMAWMSKLATFLMIENFGNRRDRCQYVNQPDLIAKLVLNGWR